MYMCVWKCVSACVYYAKFNSNFIIRLRAECFVINLLSRLRSGNFSCTLFCIIISQVTEEFDTILQTFITYFLHPKYFFQFYQMNAVCQVLKLKQILIAK